MDGKGLLGSLNVTSMRCSNCSDLFLGVYSLRLLTYRDLLPKLDNPSSVWNIMNMLTFLVEVVVVVSRSECIHPTYPRLFCTRQTYLLSLTTHNQCYSSGLWVMTWASVKNQCFHQNQLSNPEKCPKYLSSS